jgi:hypothetical protein
VARWVLGRSQVEPVPVSCWTATAADYFPVRGRPLSGVGLAYGAMTQGLAAAPARAGTGATRAGTLRQSACGLRCQVSETKTD